MAITQLSVFAQNKPGGIVEITKLLGEAGVNIRALSLADTSDYGILRLIVDKPEEGKKILTEAGLVVRVTDVLSLTMDDTPGGTLGVLRLLSESGIGVEYMYAFAGKSGAVMIIQAEDLEAAEGILQRGGFRQAEIEGI